GRLIIKVDEKTRKVIKINKLSGVSNFYETRGTGQLYNHWFEAIPKDVNIKEIKEIKKLGFFDQPSAIFSSVYSDQKQIQKKIDAMNAEIKSSNLKTSSDPANMTIKYQLTNKGKKDMDRAKAVISKSSTGDRSKNGKAMESGGIC
ncbi:hypothetical protein IDH27_02735, partial [Pelagibacterales bacterium SAG-MED46]|nr:hypothetical protein [Pelagibacterales bacterium SAG-MED46]